MELFYVSYEVQGMGPQTAGPYETQGSAQSHRNDIAGYEGVSDARVIHITSTRVPFSPNTAPAEKEANRFTLIE